MDHDTFMNLDDQGRIEYVNGRLADGDDFEAILADLGLTKKEFGQSQPYGLGLIRIGKEVKLKPGRGDNGFAW